jgi:ribonuclease VapC
MILDSSAILAIVFAEQGFEGLIERILAAELVGAGTPTLSEAGIVLVSKLGPAGRGILERFLDEFAVTTIPFGEDHWRSAVDAFDRFGRGRHPASLNFGDCLAYSTARLAALPLLYVGDDFAQTDIEAA